MRWTKQKYDKGTVGYAHAQKGRFTYDLTNERGALMGFVLTDEEGRHCATAWILDHWKNLGTHKTLKDAQRAVEQHAARAQ